MKNYSIVKVAPRAFWSFLIAVMFTAVASISSTAAWGTPSNGDGYVDSVQIDRGKLILQGWAGGATPTQRIVALSVSIDGKQIYKGPFERVERPDVVSSTKRPDWLQSGWRLSLQLNDDTSSLSLIHI